MKEDVLVPSVGESVSSGVLTAWLRKEGEQVEEGEDLFELETDKATVAVPAPAGGVLAVLVPAGQEVQIGQVVASLDTAAKPATAGAKAVPAAQAAPETKAAEAPPPGLSPAVRRIVHEAGLQPGELKGTGPQGRVTKADALEAARRAEGATPAAGAQAPPAPGGDRVRRVPMSRLRQVAAARLVQARQEIALLSTFNEIDMQRAQELRKGYGEQFAAAHGVRLGLMSFFVRAVCQALAAFPQVNAWIEGDQIVYHDYYDIGVAVSTERGLLVPVLRDADRLSMAQIEKGIADLARRAREKKIGPDELTGGTFSITNGGVFGSLLSTPLPNYPQSAILGMHAIQKRPVAVGDEVAIRPMMYVALSYDHRLIDGREAVQFLVKIKQLVESPERLLLEI